MEAPTLKGDRPRSSGSARNTIQKTAAPVIEMLAQKTTQTHLVPVPDDSLGRETKPPAAVQPHVAKIPIFTTHAEAFVETAHAVEKSRLHGHVITWKKTGGTSVGIEARTREFVNDLTRNGIAIRAQGVYDRASHHIVGKRT